MRVPGTVWVGVALLVTAQLGVTPATARAEASTPDGSVVARLPIGTGPGSVGMESAPEGEWGVSAFAIAGDGSFWLVDGINDKLVVLGADGELQREVPLPEPLVCPEDIAVTDDSVYLLDVSAQPTVLATLDRGTGALTSVRRVPQRYAAFAVTGMTVQDEPGTKDDVFLEIDDTWQVPFVRRGIEAAVSDLPLVRRQNRVDVEAQDAAALGVRDPRGRAYAAQLDADGHSGGVTVYDRGRKVGALNVRTASRLATVRALPGPTADRSYVAIEDVPAPGQVRSFVESFDARGNARAAYRIPTDRFAWYPKRGLRPGADGNVYCLVPTREGITIERLPVEATAALAASRVLDSSVSDKPSILARIRAGLSDAVRTVRRALTPSPAHAAWTRLNASDRASDYLSNSWYCNVSNYSRSCGDTRPRYITASGRTYGSVPYCWGGFDTASTFNTAMSNSKDAGDINTTGSKRSCTAGVDCSGFVSRLWGLGSKYSTNSLLNVSYAIDPDSMTGSDLWDDPGSHAIAHRYYTSSGLAAVWESTKTDQADRVVARTRSAGELAGYQSRRFYQW